MAKKEKFTLKEVEIDIINSFKHTPEMSKSSYKKRAILGGIAGAILGFVSVFKPTIGLIGLGLIVCAVVVGVTG